MLLAGIKNKRKEVKEKAEFKNTSDIIPYQRLIEWHNRNRMTAGIPFSELNSFLNLLYRWVHLALFYLADYL